MRENPGECECCGFETDDLKAYDRRGTVDGVKWLCILCASTPAGTAYEYPQQYPNQLATLQTICHVGNVLLAALKEKR